MLRDLVAIWSVKLQVTTARGKWVRGVECDIRALSKSYRTWSCRCGLALSAVSCVAARGGYLWHWSAVWILMTCGGGVALLLFRHLAAADALIQSLPAVVGGVWALRRWRVFLASVSGLPVYWLISISTAAELALGRRLFIPCAQLLLHSVCLSMQEPRARLPPTSTRSRAILIRTRDSVRYKSRQLASSLHFYLSFSQRSTVRRRSLLKWSCLYSTRRI